MYLEVPSVRSVGWLILESQLSAKRVEATKKRQIIQQKVFELLFFFSFGISKFALDYIY